jgi:hypothetical protein
MLHALTGVTNHPRWLFFERCGGVISCDDDCRQEAGGATSIAQSTPEFHRDSILVSVDFAPREVSLSGGTHGCVTVVVSVENLHGTARQLSGQISGFGWTIDRVPINLVGSPLSVGFEAGETKRRVFECPVAGRLNGIEPGTYRVRGVFGGIESQIRLLTVVD